MKIGIIRHSGMRVLPVGDVILLKNILCVECGH
jgi:hypothetical protein